MLDFRLESFLSVCDTMNYRKSAQMLHITQPAITQHIHYLEAKFGCKLFVYENRLLKKTHQGRILEQYARTMLAQEERLLRLLSRRWTLPGSLPAAPFCFLSWKSATR